MADRRPPRTPLVLSPEALFRYETERRVAAASAEQIEVWAERMRSAATLAELLAD